MFDIKLIALDLDETLLHNDRTISPRAKAAIRDATANGVAVTLATGRMFASALPYALNLGLNLPLITYQGALVKYTDGRVVTHKPINLTLARAVVSFLVPYNYHVNVYIRDELYMKRDTVEGERYANMVKVPVHWIENPVEAVFAEPTKLLVIALEEQLDALAVDLYREFGDNLNITKSSSRFLELANPDATKGNALRDLALSLGLKAENVMAVGDSLNDLDMIKYAGLGVAMSNAWPEVKKAARYVTAKNDDDGVAEAIEKFVLKKG